MSDSSTEPRYPAADGPYAASSRAGDLLFLAGQGPFLPDGALVEGPFAEQVRQTFRNLDAVARDAGSSLASAVRVGAYLSTMNHYEEFNRVMAEFFPHTRPARTTIPVDLRGFDVEIDAVIDLARR
ncbi:RidA family protein [Agromyces soli]|uniref:RidA family protein n=1 Tax=Agromyces soli TaxID=659012 RepID=A0ABY4AVH8_9MICO|nr:RidA family protein [Agromyces soli]UOE27174.1 RidA family protein [Agromyces soli]